MAEPFSMELFNRIPSEQVSFYFEWAEATGISDLGRYQVNNLFPSQMFQTVFVLFLF
jgi:hypothetical protein